MIRFENALTNPDCYRRLKALYREAFPAQEQAPLLILRYKARTRACDMLGAYDGDEFVGLLISVIHEELVYVFFLAVEADQRGAGRGTAILAEAAARYAGKTLMLCIEDPDEPCDNLPLRLRRKAFYQRNGYREAGFKVRENGVMYEMLSTQPVTYADYRRLMTAFLGRVLFRIVHSPNK